MRQRHRTLTELPEELLNEIFLRMPARSLLICKCVCKPFSRIIRHPGFVNTHLSCVKDIGHDKSEALILHYGKSKYRGRKNIKRKQLGCIHYDHVMLSIDNATINVYKPFSPPVPYVGEVKIVGSCNGLICAAVRFDNDNDDGDDLVHNFSILLWNPVTRQTRYLPRPRYYNGVHDPFFEFGFVMETSDHMVVRISDAMDHRIRADLYKMSTDSWTVIDCNSFAARNTIFLCSLFGDECPVFLNGSFHWGSWKHIVSFNLKHEELGLINLPPNLDEYRPDEDPGVDKLAVEEEQEEKSLMYWRMGDEKLQIWVRTDYDFDDSWCLRLKVSMSHHLSSSSYWKDYLIITDPTSTRYLYDLYTGNKMKIPSAETWELLGFCNYVETLSPVRYVDE